MTPESGSHQHLTPSLLIGFANQTVPLPTFFRRVLRHLEEVCPDCAAAVADAIQARDAREEEDEDQAESDLEALRARVSAERRQVEAQQPLARNDLEEILALDPEKRSAKVREIDDRSRLPVLAGLLLEESRRQVPLDAREAEALARLAEQAAEQMPSSELGTSLGHDLTTLARAYRANARRAQGDYRSAERWMRSSLDVLPTTADPLVEAEVLFLAAALERDQRRLPDAARSLDRAGSIYRRIGERHLEGKTLLSRGLLRELQGDPEAAIEDLRAALDMLDPEREPFLQFCIRHNLAWFLTGLERYGQAAAAYRACLPFYGDFPGVRIQLRRRWLEARIAYGTGRSADAEALFQQVRREFLEAGLSYDAAMASLDLALLLAREGRIEELKELAEEILAAFRAHGIQREALAALTLFQQAAAAESVTQGMIRELSAYFRAVRDASPDSPSGC